MSQSRDRGAHCPLIQVEELIGYPFPSVHEHTARFNPRDSLYINFNRSGRDDPGGEQRRVGHSAAAPDRLDQARGRAKVRYKVWRSNKDKSLHPLFPEGSEVTTSDHDDVARNIGDHGCGHAVAHRHTRSSARDAWRLALGIGRGEVPDPLRPATCESAGSRSTYPRPQTVSM